MILKENQNIIELKKIASGWDLVIKEVYCEDLDQITSYIFETFSDLSVGWYPIVLGEFNHLGFISDDEGMTEFISDLDPDEREGLESLIQRLETEFKKLLN